VNTRRVGEVEWEVSDIFTIAINRIVMGLEGLEYVGIKQS